MSDTDTNSGQTTADDSQPDPINNVKAEFQRKYGNLESEVGQLKAANQALMEQLSKINKPAASASAAEDDDELLYSNPKAFKQKLVESVKGEVKKELDDSSRAQQERVNTLANLAAEYPELNKQNSEFYQETLKALESLPEAIRHTPVGYQTAVYKTAALLGEKPMSKRGKQLQDTSDDFAFSGSKKTNTQKKSAKDDLSEKTRRWAELLGQDSEKDLEEIAQIAKKRTNFRKPE